MILYGQVMKIVFETKLTQNFGPTALTRIGNIILLRLISFVVTWTFLNNDFNAFGSERSCLRARLAFSRHFLSYFLCISKPLIRMKKHQFFIMKILQGEGDRKYRKSVTYYLNGPYPLNSKLPPGGEVSPSSRFSDWPCLLRDWWCTLSDQSDRFARQNVELCYLGDLHMKSKNILDPF